MNDPVKILLIEDNPGDSRLIQEILAEETAVSYDFKYVDRLSIGLETAANEKIDVILLDLGLPDSQGLETLKKIQAQFPGKPTVVLTGLDSKEIALEAVREGAQDYLVKGKMGSSEVLWRTIQYAIGRSQSERKLRDSEARLNEAQSLGKIGNWELNLATNEIDWSDQVYKLYERDKALGPPSVEEEASYYPAEEAGRLRELARLAIEKGEKLNYDLKAILPSGKAVFFNAWTHPLKNAEGHVIKLFGTVQDITQRKRIEQQLNSANRLYAFLSEINQAIIRIKEWDTLFQDICRIAVKIGQFRMAWIGLLDKENGIINPVMHEGYEEGYLQVLAPLRNVHPFNKGPTYTATREGKVIVCNDIETDSRMLPWREEALKRGYRSSAAVPIKLKGEVIGNLNIYADRTEFFSDEEERLLGEVGADISFALDSIETEKEHKRAEERIKSLAKFPDENPNPVLRVVHDGTIIYANKMSQILLDTWNCSVGQRLPEYWQQILAEAIDSGLSKDVECVCGARIFSLILAPIVTEGYVNIYSLDITDSKRLEEERQRVAKLESIGILAGGIAHDFNNILTAILGNISLAKMETKPESELHDRLEEAEKASLRARDLTQQLLTFSKGGAPIKKLASISELLKDTASFALRGSNIKCQFSIADDLWYAEIDQGQISQIINNMVINAQQAMLSGGNIEVRAENMALTEKQSLGKSLPLKKGKYIRIVIADHGTGMPQEYLDKIFDPFFTTKQKGSGLGLATSYSIVRNHGGHVSVESKLGTGSTFYVYLPASTKTATTRKTEEKQTIPVSKARILVMDDEETVREVAGRMLKHIGYEDIQLAADGAEAIKLYKEAMKAGKPFDAVILDITIPGGMGGKEAIKKLLEIDTEIKAIVSSGYSNESAIADYKEYGFKGMVAKPYTIEQLRKALHELIG